jgi:hypothetical protein
MCSYQPTPLCPKKRKIHSLGFNSNDGVEQKAKKQKRLRESSGSASAYSQIFLLKENTGTRLGIFYPHSNKAPKTWIQADVLNHLNIYVPSFSIPS